MTSWEHSDSIPNRRTWLWVEFFALFIAAPIAMAVLLPPGWMFPVLFLFMGVGLVLLHRTPEFKWTDLLSGARQIDWKFTRIFIASVAAACVAVMYLTSREQMFMLLYWRPELLLMIVLLYPLLSALPQELIYRPLFFRRYGQLLPSAKVAIVLNAAIFSLAHLMYWSAIVAAMTFIGGLVFAWSYEKRRNFPQAVLLHAIAGNIIFIVGLGVFFYSGNAQRPF